MCKSVKASVCPPAAAASAQWWGFILVRQPEAEGRVAAVTAGPPESSRLYEDGDCVEEFGAEAAGMDSCPRPAALHSVLDCVEGGAGRLPPS